MVIREGRYVGMYFVKRGESMGLYIKTRPYYMVHYKKRVSQNDEFLGCLKLQNLAPRSVLAKSL